LASSPLPTLGARPDPRAEAWRFTPLHRMASLWDVAADPAALQVTDVDGVLTVQGLGAELTGAAAHSITLDPHEQRTVLIRHTGAATYAFDLTVVVGDGARLDLVVVHDGSAAAVLQESVQVSLGRDATLNAVVCTLGGSLVRQVTQLTYAGPGGSAEWHGLAIAGAGQHHEHRQHVDHSTPHCRSRVTSRMALVAATARTVWVGDVIIRPAAVATDTHEDNRNLVLADGARADAVPNLEIETGDVAHAGHASATGRFDDQQMFYLQSRGIPIDQARRLVVGGFLAQVTDRIPAHLHEVRTEIASRIDTITAGAS
jgi:Fe-S cluster assembly protein SufD